MRWVPSGKGSLGLPEALAPLGSCNAGGDAEWIVSPRVSLSSLAVMALPARCESGGVRGFPAASPEAPM